MLELLSQDTCLKRVVGFCIPVLVKEFIPSLIFIMTNNNEHRVIRMTKSLGLEFELE